MKRICCIISLFVLCLTFNQAHAQRCLPGMKGLQVTGGMADGVHWNSKSDFAYYFGAAMSAYTKNGNRWVIGGEYLEKHYPCLLYTSPSPRDVEESRMPSSA